MCVSAQVIRFEISTIVMFLSTSVLVVRYIYSTKLIGVTFKSTTTTSTAEITLVIYLRRLFSYTFFTPGNF